MDDPRAIKRKARVTPFGYKTHPDDRRYLLPVSREIEALHKANEMIKDGYTWRSVKDWVIRASGREISLEGLRMACKKIRGVYSGKLDHVPLPEKSPTKNPGTPIAVLDDKDKRPYHISRKQSAKLAIKRSIRNADAEKDEVAIKLQNLKAKVKKKKEDLKQFERVLEGKSPIIEDAQILSAPPAIQKQLVDPDRPIIFEPNPGPQTQFLAANETEVFYGGARGGGKSFSLIVDPLRYCDKEAHRAVIIRRTMPELRDLINHSHRLYPKAFPSAKTKWREQEKEWRFPSGARIEFGYAETAQDALRYQGQSYSWIGVDELPQYPEPQIWNDLRGSLRSVDPSIPTFMRATGNPGGAGSAWVKDTFVSPAPWNTRFFEEIELPDGSIEKISRRFIPAKLQDNPYLMKTRSYIAMLASLPEIQRRQWLEGDWDAWDGAAFPEFRTEIHTCAPFEIPKTWIRFRACDWGYSSAFAVLWIAVDYDYNLWVYREFYGNKLTADVFAKKVLSLDNGEKIHFGVMDASVWAKRGDVGPSIVEQMRMNGLVWRPSDRSVGSRKNGKMEVHRRLLIDPDRGEPRLKIFSNCRQLIRDLPTLPIDDNDPEDVDTNHPHDHTYDALRYGCMARALSPSRVDWVNAMIEQERFAPSDVVFGY